ncbi:hypothetical protein glysoja_041623 [Glycine soja]|uniref:Uncharacterized protein n=1 Tax=Glycine soja TaxID=3848 RepID=A0A0B2Q1W8_GLYSO|nr:hypothetical protein glysoja_041623 [Glycine soja]
MIQQRFALTRLASNSLTWPTKSILNTIVYKLLRRAYIFEITCRLAANSLLPGKCQQCSMPSIVCKWN